MKKKSLSRDYVYGLLRSKNINDNTIRQIKECLTWEAVHEASNVQFDRIFTAMCMAIREEYGFGGKKILRAADRANKILISIGESEESWQDLMQNLREETGIIVRTGDDRFVIEFQTGDRRD